MRPQTWPMRHRRRRRRRDARRQTRTKASPLSRSLAAARIPFRGQGDDPTDRPTARLLAARLFIPFVRPFKNRRSFKDPGQTLARRSTHCIQTGILPGAFSPRVCLYRARQCTQTSLERKQTEARKHATNRFSVSEVRRFSSFKLGNIIGIIRDYIPFDFDRSRMIRENWSS